MAIRVTCTSCGSAYKIDENKIPLTGGAIRCQNCGTRFAVQRPAPEDAAPAVTAPALAPFSLASEAETQTRIQMPPSPPAPMAEEVTKPKGAALPPLPVPFADEVTKPKLAFPPAPLPHE